MQTFLLHDRLFVRQWLPPQPVAVVQVVHGMAEHSGRYGRFASFLNEQGIAVYAHDHRGHGYTAGSPERIGFFAPECGWELVVQDIRLLHQEIARRHPGLPVVLFGHSMGSFLSREFASRWGEDLAGLVLSGTATPPKTMLLGGLALARLQMALRGKRARSRLLDRLTFGRYNASVKHHRTGYDWISRDDAQVDDYAHCPWCGGVFTTAFFRDLFTGLLRLHGAEHLAGLPAALPVLLIAGDNDPVGNRGRDVRDLFFCYRSIGLRDVQMRLFEGARHSLLHETNADEVQQVVLAWLRRHLPQIITH